MALNCLLSKVAKPQSFFRGQALRTAKNLLIRSSVSMSTINLPQLSKPIENKNHTLLNKSNRIVLTCVAADCPYPSSGSIRNNHDDAHKHHNHVPIWQMERLVSVGLLPLIPAALAMPSQILDTIVAVLIVMHTHWGLEAVVVDYIRPILFGDLVPKVGLVLLYIFSIVTMAGLLNLIYNDFGLANSILKILKC